CDVVFKRSVLRYEAEYTEKAILREKLSLITGDEETVLIERLPTGRIRGEIIMSSDANQLYVKEMQPNVTVLSKLAQHGPRRGKESVYPYYQAIQGATRFEDYSSSTGFQIKLGDENEDKFADDAEYREWIMN